MQRDDLLFSWLKQLPVERNWHWLDLGAGDGEVSQQIKKRLWPHGTFNGLDVQVMPNNPNIRRFDGKHIPFPDHSFDFVLLNFVLHHAAHNQEMLILEAARVTRGPILIQEDIDDGTDETRANLKKHDPKVIYHSISGWVEKFKSLLPACNIICTPHENRVPRALFIVSPRNGVPSEYPATF